MGFFDDAWEEIKGGAEDAYGGYLDVVDPAGMYHEGGIYSGQFGGSDRGSLGGLGGQSGFGAQLFDPITGQSTRDALDAQERAAKQAADAQTYMYDQSRADQQPWRETGGRALSQLESGDFAKNLQMDPGYQFRLEEGQKALRNAAGARGGRQGGATMKALTRYNQDYASGEYGKAYDRQYGRLSQLAGFGGQATSQGSQQSMQQGQSLANIYSNLGNAQGSAQIAQGNRMSNLYGQAAMGYGMYLASDSRLKNVSVKIPREDLKEMKAHLKAIYFKYKDSNYGKGEWSGVMAQDLEKSRLGRTLVSEDNSGTKFVDTQKVMSMFLATMAEGV